MHRRLRALGLALPLLAAACGDGSDSWDPRRAVPEIAGSDAARVAGARDNDADGLCDASEARLRTNPDELDSDHDGFPDVVEVLGGFSPTDPFEPGLDQVGYLVGVAGRELDLELRTTVTGSGQGASGQFLTARTAFDAHGLTAQDFFASAEAVSAVPPDNVGGMAATQERFMAILGKTRLIFRLHFEFKSDVTLDCAPALPFQYAIKADDGQYLASRDYLLVVAPGDEPLKPLDYCRPASCL